MKAAVLEDSHEQWHEDAVATIVALAKALDVFSADDLAREMRPAPHPNAPGQAFAAARALGHITSVGYQHSTLKSRKFGVIRTWKRQTKREGTP